LPSQIARKEGTISDEAGAAMPGVTIVATYTGTTAVREAETEAKGLHRQYFPNESGEEEDYRPTLVSYTRSRRALVLTLP
jgi:hypothetical protein